VPQKQLCCDNIDSRVIIIILLPPNSYHSNHAANFETPASRFRIAGNILDSAWPLCNTTMDRREAVNTSAQAQ
jgi:hypothetical protein